MKKLSFILFAIVILTLGISFMMLYAGNEGHGKMSAKVVEGTLIDTKCYSMGGFVTNDHKDMKGNKLPSCATACASMGIPVGVLDKDKNVTVIAGPAPGYSKWMAMKVRVTGMYGKYANVFIPQKIEVQENGKWVKKELPGAMM